MRDDCSFVRGFSCNDFATLEKSGTFHCGHLWKVATYLAEFTLLTISFVYLIAFSPAL